MRARWRSAPVVGAVVVAATLALAGCGDDDRSTPASSATAGDTLPPAASTAATTSPPATPDAASAAAQRVLGWVAGTSPDQGTYERSVGAEFLGQVPYDQFVALLDQLRAAGPWTAGPPTVVGTGRVSVPLTNPAGDQLSMLVTTGEDDTAIQGLWFQPIVPPPATVEAAITALQQQGTLRLLAAEVVDDTCVPSVAVDADTLMPLGSAFKLYVLGAVVDAARRGDLSWDQPVVIRDELDSIPSGITQNEPPGTQLAVRELASRMISISDNTATDHLIVTVGRDAVEAAQAAYGHQAPARNEPFLTTREFTIIKYSGTDLLQRYLAASPEERRTLLATEVASAPLPPLETVAAAPPTAVEDVEWFAAPADLCRALVALDRSPDAGAILALNPGVPSTNPAVARVGFKGGSEPGVLATAWIVETTSGRRFVVAGGVSNPTTPVDESVAVAMLSGVRDLTVAD